MALVVESPGIINKLNLVHDLVSHLQSRRKDECPCASEPKPRARSASCEGEVSCEGKASTSREGEASTSRERICLDLPDDVQPSNRGGANETRFRLTVVLQDLIYGVASSTLVTSKSEGANRHR